ncbi:MAG: anhydro-N-acetylmuramic acid kinase [Gemmataceae bacterium]
MTSRWLIGLASGSTVDGVDAALMELESVGLNLRVRQVQGLHQPYGQELRALILRVSGSAPCETRQVSLVHRLLGETFAAAARTVADHASLSLQRVQCIGCPGHTVWHDAEGRFPTTLGLGMAAVVAERCGVTTVSDFRSRDVAAGGQGVPLAALTDYILFRHPQESRLLIHLGGLARVVFVPAGCRIHEVVGFEASPCNVLLDALMGRLSGGKSSFDPGGKHAVQGKCIDALLQSWLNHPYLQRRPPKGLPRHLFGDDFAAAAVQQARQLDGSLHDLLCTANHFVARGITTALRRFLPSQPRVDRVLLSGGGVRNGLLWRLLEQPFEGVPLQRTDEVGVPADVRKALSFGMLAALTLDGVPASVPSATGAAGSRLLGSITPGSSMNWAKCVAWMAAQTTPPFCPEI